MMDKQDIEIRESYCDKDTYEIGFKMGQQAAAGDVTGLIGDLGAGKTVFTKGFAKGLGIAEPVSSPTFTILQIYEEGRLPLYHFDVYRIEDADELEDIGFDEFLFGEGVCLIEWADLIEDVLPEGCRMVRIEKDPVKGFDYRRIRVFTLDGSGSRRG